MPGIIRVLPSHVINQIAAGEVIENPASVVKELVENAIDAGSSKIVVEISGGGLQKIRISDNGVGMTPEDAVLCLERHATSKISTAEELSSVATMGFRGEALASIASISKMTIQTARKGEVGTQVDVEGGSISRVQPCARAQGTAIEVRQLFYNVPARRKFQKSPALCFADIVKMMTSLSLAYPKVSFDLYENEQEKLRLFAQEGSLLESLHARVKDVLGESFLEDATCVEASFGSLAFRGVLGGVHNTRPTRSLQYAFLNQRSVLCPALSYAMKDSFGTRIAADRFPIYVMHLDIPAAFIDVNVHPQKKEVRLREERWIKEELQKQIEEKLFIKEQTFTSTDLSSTPVSFHMFSPEYFLPKASYKEVALLEREEVSLQTQEPKENLWPVEKKVVPIGVYEHFLWIEASSASYLPLDIASDGIAIVDLKAAGARLLFESFTEKTSQERQMLLFPLSFSCSLAEVEELLIHEKELEQMGFSLRLAGKQSFFIEAIPSLLSEQEAVEFLKTAFLEDRGESWDVKKERRLASSCCRLLSLRKEGYGVSQGLEVLYALAKVKNPLFCPLGNKTIIQVRSDELQQQFKKKR